MRASLLAAGLGLTLAVPALGSENPGVTGANILQVPMSARAMGMGGAFTAVGTAIASLVEDFQAFPLVMNFLIMPLFFLSGAIFPLQGLGDGMRMVTHANPLGFGMDGIRGALTGLWQFNPTLDVTVLAVLALVMLGFGSLMFSRIEA